MTDLGYFAADTLQMTLYQIDGRLVSHEVHPLGLGPWRLELPIEVESDILGAKELSFWLTLGKSLHAYLVVREKENWLFVLNREKLETCELASYTAKGRVDDIKSAVCGAFRWANDGWTPVEYDGGTHSGRGNAHNLDKGGSGQGVGQSASGSANGTQLIRRSRQ